MFKFAVTIWFLIFGRKVKVKLKDTHKCFINSGSYRKWLFSNNGFFHILFWTLHLAPLNVAFVARRIIRRRYSSEINKGSYTGLVFFPHPISIVIGSGIEQSGRLVVTQNVTIGGNFGRKGHGNIRYPVFSGKIWIGPGTIIGGPVILNGNLVISGNSVITKSIGRGLFVGGSLKSKNLIFNDLMSNIEIS